MKITMCQGHDDWNSWLKSIEFCCSTMETEFFRETFGFSNHFANLTIPNKNESSASIKNCPYCKETIKFNILFEDRTPELSITLYHRDANCCNYLSAFSVCCESMNILDINYLKSSPTIAKPTDMPIEIDRDGIGLNGVGIKRCPYCETKFKIYWVEEFNVN